MSDAPSRTRAASLSPLDREDVYIKRHERSIASLVSLLVHVLFVAALLYSSRITLSQPESSSSGGARVKVDFLGDPTDATPNPPVPPTGTQNPSERPKPLKPLVTTPLTTPLDAPRVSEAENPRAPLSDQRLAEILKAEGIPVARRTVAKYREAMNISASNERQRLG